MTERQRFIWNDLKNYIVENIDVINEYSKEEDLNKFLKKLENSKFIPTNELILEMEAIKSTVKFRRHKKAIQEYWESPEGQVNKSYVENKLKENAQHIEDYKLNVVSKLNSLFEHIFCGTDYEISGFSKTMMVVRNIYNQNQKFFVFIHDDIRIELNDDIDRRWISNNLNEVCKLFNIITTLKNNSKYILSVFVEEISNYGNQLNELEAIQYKYNDYLKDPINNSLS